MLGLYIHIPFCRKICDYCDFFAMHVPERLHEEYLNLLFMEMKIFAERNPNVFPCIETLYLGGGTPSVLSKKNLNKLFEMLKFLGVPLQNLKESTMEFNPESCNEDKLAIAIENGINRISIGIQSFNSDILKNLGREVALEQNIKVLEMLTKISNIRINADLMFNLPGQMESQFLDDLKKLSSYPIGHISFYGLKIDTNTRLGHNVKKGLLQIDEDLYADMYLKGVEFLENKGFKRYETSNFSKNGEESLHNLNYWNRGEYLGFGPSAHSFYKGSRFFAPEHYAPWKHYVKEGAPISSLEKDIIGPKEKIAETIQLSLRTKKGLNLLELKNLGAIISMDSILYWKKKGYLEYSNNHISLKNKGWIFMDTIVLDLYSHVNL